MITDANAKREWTSRVCKIFDSYTDLLWGYDPDEVNEEDKKWIDFYENIVKKTQVEIARNKSGVLVGKIKEVDLSTPSPLKPD